MKSENHGTDYLIDSNILIYASKQVEGMIAFMSNVKLKDARVCASWCTYIEALGYHKLTPDEKDYLEVAFSAIEKLDVSEQVAGKATELRQQRRMGLGDSIIAATAIVNGLCLVTHNTQDFDWIDELAITDPILS